MPALQLALRTTCGLLSPAPPAAAQRCVWLQAQIDAQRSRRTPPRPWLRRAHNVALRTGSGITGWVPCGAADDAAAAARVAIGNKALMAELGVDTRQAEHAAWLRAQEDRGRTGLYVAVGAHLVALLSVQDPLKPEARGTVSRLMQAGVRRRRRRMHAAHARCSPGSCMTSV
jgi:cation transport ATPase